MKKKNTALFIDGENISAKESAKIFDVVQRIGQLDQAKVYGLQKDTRTKAWSQLAKTNESLKDVRLCGGPAPDKVDKKIQKDIASTIKKQKNIDIVVIVSCDHGYASIVREARAAGKRVVIVGKKNTSKKIVSACNKFECI